MRGAPFLPAHLPRATTTSAKESAFVGVGIADGPCVPASVSTGDTEFVRVGEIGIDVGRLGAGLSPQAVRN